MQGETSGLNIQAGDRVVVVTGGNGFIGSYVAKFYHDQGCHVRIADISSRSKFEDRPFYTECIIGDLCDINFCRRVVRGASIVLHFAAVMGGMGVIHSSNDHLIYRANHSMTQNLLEASVEFSVVTFFYASSACVYPGRLQALSDDHDVSLKEDDVYGTLGEGPDPQGLYGLEKLHSEQLVLQYASRMNIRIGRFHNVYGPRGSWNDGHEKAPAAFIRKALALKSFTGSAPKFEIWGDGNQRRSFLYIDDAVSAVALLVDSSFSTDPLNIGSAKAISILELARLSIKVAGLEISKVHFDFKKDRPVGVASRNSDNTRVFSELGWYPKVDPEEGLSRTARWMTTEIERLLSGTDETSQQGLVSSLMTSPVLNLNNEGVIYFAILLPITSRGAAPGKCIENLSVFAASLQATTWRDRNTLCATRYNLRIYLAIDDDDTYLLPTSSGEDGRAESVIRAHGFSDVVTIVSPQPKGHICALWRECAGRAYMDRCDYYVLLGDDIELLDEGWMRDIDSRFGEVAEMSGGPKGFGCVAFTDMSFPGMPTFPVVHRTHLQIFEGEIVPTAFINQDGDPYLFQLYRHFGASMTVQSRLRNVIGGSDDARYKKELAVGWTFETLDLGKNMISEWADVHAPLVKKMISLDIIVPSYRVTLELLERILALKPSKTCTTMFVIIIDNPSSPAIYELLHKHAGRMDVRIRVNKSNRGASAARNRGLSESCAEWVAFLDDDVNPVPQYLVEAERAIRAHPDAAGFVGNTYFPVASNVFTTAVHLAGVTYFWDIANKIEYDIPWGVTANLIVRRNVRDNVLFDLRFPKTGGGEDIDFCRKKRQSSLDRGGGAFWAAPRAEVTHPWWQEGKRSYWRFYMWAKGDGALVKMYPQLSWRDWTPNSAEVVLFSPSLVLLGLGLGKSNEGRALCLAGVLVPVTTLVVNVSHDAYRHLVRDRARTRVYRTSVGRFGWMCAVFESGLIRMASEAGRMVGLLERRDWLCLGRRFDWFCGNENAVREERTNGVQRFGLIAISTALIVRYACK